MNQEDLARWCAKHGVSYEGQDLRNKGLRDGHHGERLNRELASTEARMKTALQGVPDGPKISKAEEEAINKKTLSAYARREYARFIAAEELRQKHPDKWQDLPRRDIRDVDTSGEGAGLIVMPGSRR